MGGGGGGPGDRGGGAQCSLNISCNKLERFMLPSIFTKVQHLLVRTVAGSPRKEETRSDIFSRRKRASLLQFARQQPF